MASQFKFTALTPTMPELLNVVTAVLGVKGEQFTNKDANKAVKMANDGCSYVLCVDGQDIEGFVDSVDVAPMNSEFNTDGTITTRRGGGVRRNPIHREEVTVATGSDKLAPLDYVVAAAQLPLGTAGLAQVKKGTPVRHFWRVISIIKGDGSAGSTVVIERDD